MLQVYERVSPVAGLKVDLSLCLPFDERKKSRLKALAESGETLGLILPRGKTLKDGDLLKSDCGRVIVVKAAEETVSRVTCHDAHLLMRCAYHLGNRHVPLQIERDALIYQQDDVLDDMVTRLGASVMVLQHPFDPEDGAYSEGHHHSGHAHED